MTVHRLTFEGGAQSVRSVVLRDDGRPVSPASCTYAVVDLRYSADDAAHEVETGSATLDATSTTLSAAAGRGATDPRSLTVASATGITAGRRYLLQSGGRAEIVRVAGVSGTTVRLASPVVGAFASGSTFTGVEVSATVTADTCALSDYLDEPNSLAIRWEPASLRPFLEALHVERLTPPPLVSPDEVLRLDATLHLYADENMSAADAAQQACDDWGVDMLAAGVDDDEVLGGPIAKRAVVHLAAWHLLKGSTDPSAVDRANKYHARYGELRNSLLQGWDKKKTARLTRDASKTGEAARNRFASSW